MKKTNNPLKTIAIINIAISTLILIDVKLPSNNIKIETYDSVASITKSYAGYKSSGGQEKIDVLYCTENNYRIGNVPEATNNLKTGEKIKIIKTALFGKASLLGIEKKSTTTWHNLTLISNYYIIRILISAIIISLIYLFYQKTFMDFLLAFSTASIFFISLAYFFYF